MKDLGSGIKRAIEVLSGPMSSYITVVKLLVRFSLLRKKLIHRGKLIHSFKVPR